MTFTVQETPTHVIVWSEGERFGFRFEKGDILAQYRFIVLCDRTILTTVEGMQELDRVRAEFLTFARENYPREFRTEIH